MKTISGLFIAALAAFLIFAAEVSFANYLNAPTLNTLSGGELVVGNFHFVKAKPGISQAALAVKLQTIGGIVEEALFLERWYVASWVTGNPEDIHAAIIALAEVEGSDYVDIFHPNQLYPPEPNFTAQWPMHDVTSNPAYDIDAPEAWTITRGNANVGIYLLDSGWPGNVGHSDLDDDRILMGPGFHIYDDNVFYPYPADTDELGHATLMASVISADWDGDYYAGLASDCYLLCSSVMYRVVHDPYQLCPQPGGTAIDLVHAFQWLRATWNPAHPNNPVKIVVTPFSWYRDGGDWQGILEAEFVALNNAGITVVASAGQNTPRRSPDVYPPAKYAGIGHIPGYKQGYPNVIAVGAYDRNGLHCEWSPYLMHPGPVTRGLLVAPGGRQVQWNQSPYPYPWANSCYSTTCVWPCWGWNGSFVVGEDVPVDCPSTDNDPNTNDFEMTEWYWFGDGNGLTRGLLDGTFSGTSCAAAHVAGVAALVQSVDPSLTPAEVKDIVLESAIDAPGQVGMGDGRLNALRAVLLTPGLKTLQANLTIPADVGSVTIAGELRVPANRTLTIAAGVTVEMLAGAKINAQTGGRVVVNGTANSHVQFVFTGETGQLYLYGGTDASRNTFVYCDFAGPAFYGPRPAGGSFTTFNQCTFNDFTLPLFISPGATVKTIDCHITGGSYGVANFGNLTMVGGEVQEASLVGVSLYNYSACTIDGTNIHNNCETAGQGYIYGGLRNLHANLKLHCIESTLNFGPGLLCLGGYTNMGWHAFQLQNGKNCIYGNSANGSLPRAQVYVGVGANFDMCNGRNRVQAGTGALIMDAHTNRQAWVIGNNWGGREASPGALPPSYDWDPVDPATACPRCAIVNYQTCLASESQARFEEALDLEYDMLYADAILVYRSIISDFPGSKEAKLCPDRIIFCEKYSQRDWSDRRTYFLNVANTTQDEELEYECRASAAWCLVEQQQYETAEQEFVALLDEFGSDYQYHKTTLTQLMAELQSAEWDDPGVLSAGNSQPDRAADVLGRMEAVLSGGGSDRMRESVPTTFELCQNYPNPFNAVTEIRFDLPETVNVELTIFNTLGQKVATLVNESRAAGAYRVEWNGSNVASGVYLYQLKAGNFNQTRKLMLLK